MKKSSFSLVTILFLFSAIAAEAQIPEILIGQWSTDSKDKILVMKDDTIVYTDKSGGIENIHGGKLFKSDKTNSFLAFKITRMSSDGFDQTETFKNYFIAFQFDKETENTLAVNFVGGGRGLTDEANLLTEIAPKKDWWNQKIFKKIQPGKETKPAKAQKKLLDSAVFGKDEITFADHPGLVFRLSKPYMRYQEWDKEHTGDADFAIALEFTNKSQQNITAISFIVKLYDKKGKILSDYTGSTSPFTIRPNEGPVLKPGYRGVDPYFGGSFSDKTFFEKFDKLDFKITEVKTASASLNEKPVFEESWMTFKDHPGISVRLSKPYTLLDDLSGSERFAIAMEFKNETKKPLKFMYFFTRVFDDQGPVYENEIQEHNMKYNPPPRNPMVEDFPDGYSGIDKSFYTGETSLFKKFKKIEIELKKVE